jgi:hypothetical protein
VLALQRRHRDTGLTASLLRRPRPEGTVGATIALTRVQDPRVGRSFALLRSISTTRRRHVVPRIAEANSNFSRMYYGLLVRLGFAALLLVSGSALAAAVAPPLNTAASYTVLGTNSVPTAGTVTCTNSGSGPPSMETLAPPSTRSVTAGARLRGQSTRRSPVRL